LPELARKVGLDDNTPKTKLHFIAKAIPDLWVGTDAFEQEIIAGAAHAGGKLPVARYNLVSAQRGGGIQEGRGETSCDLS
jgi:hypothetical protein